MLVVHVLREVGGHAGWWILTTFLDDVEGLFEHLLVALLGVPALETTFCGDINCAARAVGLVLLAVSDLMTTMPLLGCRPGWATPSSWV